MVGQVILAAHGEKVTAGGVWWDLLKWLEECVVWGGWQVVTWP